MLRMSATKDGMSLAVIVLAASTARCAYSMTDGTGRQSDRSRL
jgi:hypothetical protein